MKPSPFQIKRRPSDISPKTKKASAKALNLTHQSMEDAYGYEDYDYDIEDDG